MRTREEALNCALDLPDTYLDTPFHDTNWQLVRIKGSGKSCMMCYEHQGQIWINLKVRPGWAAFWRERYEAVRPAYHQNKDHWISVILDGSMPDEEVCRMIAESYDLVTDSASRRIYEAVKRIPYGHVATYGQIAALAGDPKMSRAVGNALHKNPEPGRIPCFRVVNAQGKLSGAFAFGGPGRQQALLEAEGVVVENGKVDLGRYGWTPEISEEMPGSDK